LTTDPTSQAVPLWVSDIAAKLPPTSTPTPLWVDDLPIADWYPDPLHGGRLRYWNGRGWTELTIAATLCHSQEASGDNGSVRTPDDRSAPGQSGGKREPVRAALFGAFRCANGELKDVVVPAQYL